jgi:hypothetical protein
LTGCINRQRPKISSVAVTGERGPYEGALKQRINKAIDRPQVPLAGNIARKGMIENDQIILSR